MSAFEDHLNAIRDIHKKETEGIEKIKNDYFNMGRENWEKNINQIGHALVLLRREKSSAYPDGCWCDVCINNPNVTKHTKACEYASAIFKHLGYEPKDPYLEMMKNR